MEDLTFFQNNQHEFLVGLDEVGRGPLAGPVVAGGAFFSKSAVNNSNVWQFLKDLGVTDSKKLKGRDRRRILDQLNIDVEGLSSGQKIHLDIDKNFSISVGVVEISNTQVDQINILRASLVAMEQTWATLVGAQKNGVALVDGNRSPFQSEFPPDCHCVVKGDSRCLSIGLASIVAKEYRDQLMEKMGDQYPGYGFERHAGYPTVAHKAAIAKLGVTPIHRKTFKGVSEHVQGPK